MIDIFELCPKPGNWQVAWDIIHEKFSWIRDLQGCPQNPLYHAEGDVWVHTRMVCESMAGLDAWRVLGETLRQDLFAAALLHDSAKPECTKVQANGRVTSRGHARCGALLARRVLWNAGVPAERRERICSLVRHHMVPLYLRDSEHRDRQALTISQSLRCDLLGILGAADAQGRICEDSEDLSERHRAYEQICRGLGCFETPFEFPSRATRFQYFHHLIDDPRTEVGEDGQEVVLMCGLPGAGKQDWVSKHQSDRHVLDVDKLRQALGVTWWDNQGAVISAARDQARELLSRKESFVWLDLNLSRQLRDHQVKLFAEYGAQVRIVHLEASPEAMNTRLRGIETRETDRKFLLNHWEVPVVSEAHRVDFLEIESPRDEAHRVARSPDRMGKELRIVDPRRLHVAPVGGP